MAYLTYRADVERSLRRSKGPAKKWAKSLIAVHDPFKLLFPTFNLVALVFWTGIKICFFTIRKILNR